MKPIILAEVAMLTKMDFVLNTISWQNIWTLCFLFAANTDSVLSYGMICLYITKPVLTLGSVLFQKVLILCIGIITIIQKNITKRTYKCVPPFLLISCLQEELGNGLDTHLITAKHSHLPMLH